MLLYDLTHLNILYALYSLPLIVQSAERDIQFLCPLRIVM